MLSNDCEVACQMLVMLGCIRQDKGNDAINVKQTKCLLRVLRQGILSTPAARTLSVTVFRWQILIADTVIVQHAKHPQADNVRAVCVCLMACT